jgi:hypothetical protein
VFASVGYAPYAIGPAEAGHYELSVRLKPDNTIAWVRLKLDNMPARFAGKLAMRIR